jgi:hypothetical protein
MSVRPRLICSTLNEEDFCEQVDGVMTVGEFYEKSAGAEIIFT